MFVVLVCVLLFSNIVAKNEEYKGYKVYNIELLSEDQQENFHKLKSDLIDFWKKPSQKYQTVGKAMVPPSHLDWFEEQLADMDIRRDVFVEDVYQYLNKKDEESSRNTREDSDVFDFNAYHRYDVILNHLYSLQEAYYANSDIQFQVIQYGITTEGRPLVYIQISSDNSDKPRIVVEAGANPREWITVPSSVNVINHLLEDDRQLLEDFVWIVIPVLNPDGYEYTHTNLRLWTKSMSTSSHLGFICPGVHINRNFDIDWQISDSSSSPCSHLYAGTNAFSEIETQMIKHILEEFNPTLYIAFENSGKFVTYPWAFEKAATGLFRRHYLLGLDIVNALSGYELDSKAIVLGDRESGTSTDYARFSGNSLYTYSIGIEGEGDDGVFVSEDRIRTVVEELWGAVRVAARGVLLN